MQGTIAPLLERFGERPEAVKDELRRCAENDPQGFLKNALPIVRSGADTTTRLYLVRLLLKSHLLVEYLADPAQCGSEEAMAVAKAVRDLGAPVGTDLDRLFQAWVLDKNSAAALIRLMDLSRELGLDKLVVQYQRELMAHPDTKVRSKAALEIGRCTSSTSWVVRMLMQDDPRAQANAVESLWDAEDSNVQSVLWMASRSTHNRVALNGVYGLYRHGAMESVPLLLSMAAQADPERRAGALWAMGETKDTRFLPWLTREFEKTDGKERQRVLRAMSRIRQQVRAYAAAGEIRMTLVESGILSDKSRRIAVALWSQHGDLPELSRQQFAMWENDDLITDYSVRCRASPPLLMMGIAVPQFGSKADPYALAVEESLKACLELKRSADPWCVIRYRIDIEPPAETAACIAFEGRSEPSSPDICSCVERLVDITSSASGPRHLVLFLTPEIAEKAPLRRLAQTLRGVAVTLHGFVAGELTEDKAIRDLCAPRNGTFQVVSVKDLLRSVTETYLSLLNRYEIRYHKESGPVGPAVCDVRVSSPLGLGELKVELGGSA